MEGAELLVLLGAKKILLEHKLVIFLSTASGLDVHRQCCMFLSSLNYDLKAIDDKKDIDRADELLASHKMNGSTKI